MEEPNHPTPWNYACFSSRESIGDRFGTASPNRLAEHDRLVGPLFPPAAIAIDPEWREVAGGGWRRRQGPVCHVVDSIGGRKKEKGMHPEGKKTSPA